MVNLLNSEFNIKPQLIFGIVLSGLRSLAILHLYSNHESDEDRQNKKDFSSGNHRAPDEVDWGQRAPTFLQNSRAFVKIFVMGV